MVTSHPPLAQGGHLVIAEALASALRAAGHEAGVLLTPQNRFGRQGSAYLANWLTDVGAAHDGRRIDQVISMRFPSYAVRHPAHVCWLNHRMREYYDRWPVFSRSLPRGARLKERARRRLVHAADRRLLTRNVTRVFAQSRTVQARLRRWGGIESEVVYPPPPPRGYRSEAYGDDILVVSRLETHKRVGLVLDALAEPEAAGVRCTVAGDGADAARLRRRAAERGVDRRVTFLGAVDEPALLDALARCRAVCFPAHREDFGLVTVEAFASARPVVTCADSGGPAELVRHGENGLVAAPDPPALAGALAALAADRGLAERLGAAARRDVDAITWERALDRLVIA